MEENEKNTLQFPFLTYNYQIQNGIEIQSQPTPGILILDQNCISWKLTMAPTSNGISYPVSSLKSSSTSSTGHPLLTFVEKDGSGKVLRSKDVEFIMKSEIEKIFSEIIEEIVESKTFYIYKIFMKKKSQLGKKKKYVEAHFLLTQRKIFCGDSERPSKVKIVSLENIQNIRIVDKNNESKFEPEGDGRDDTSKHSVSSYRSKQSIELPQGFGVEIAYTKSNSTSYILIFSDDLQVTRTILKKTLEFYLEKWLLLFEDKTHQSKALNIIYGLSYLPEAIESMIQHEKIISSLLSQITLGTMTLKESLLEIFTRILPFPGSVQNVLEISHDFPMLMIQFIEDSSSSLIIKSLSKVIFFFFLKIGLNL